MSIKKRSVRSVYRTKAAPHGRADVEAPAERPNTTTPIRKQPYPILGHIEDATMVVFVFDYLIRVLTVHAVPQRCGETTGPCSVWGGH